MLGFGEFDECEWEIDFKDEFNRSLELRTKKLSLKSDDEVLRIAFKCGPELNKVTEHFPAYDVALKIKNNNWIPTEKQRKAIINVTAFFQTKKIFIKRYGDL
jgi:hypothetical protein